MIRIIEKTIIVLFVLIGYTVAADFELKITDDPSDLLLLKCQDSELHLLKGMGPIFEVDQDVIGPKDYEIKVVDSSMDGLAKSLKCKVIADDFEAEYEIQMLQKESCEVQISVYGTRNVSEFYVGTIEGTDKSLKQFFTGDRESESYPQNGNISPSIYWPQKELYINCDWDMDYTNSMNYKHRLLPKMNYVAANIPISCDFSYAVLSDGTRPNLKERFTVRCSKDLWQTLGPQNNPSEYKNELVDMIYFDSWTEKFIPAINALTWLKDITADRVKFYTIVQTWADWNGWDLTNPDAYRIPDHAQPGKMYGTKDQLLELMSVAKSMGRAGLRCNYMWIGPDSWSVKEGFVEPAIGADGENSWFTNFYSVKALVERQENDIKKDFAPTTALHDQWASAGTGWPLVNYDAKSPGAGTISGVRAAIKDICKYTKNLHNGPLSSETLNSEYLIGEFIDTGDFGIYGADDRFDINPEYKLRRLHEQTVSYGMGLGYRFFFTPSEKDWAKVDGTGYDYYFDDDEKLDKYRSCEILWGNGGYLFFRARMRKVHALEECMTVGIAQRYYLTQPLDYVKMSNGGRWKTFDYVIKECDTREEIFDWQKRFHIRFKNGCNIFVNRSETPLQVRYLGNKMVTLAQDGWLVYTEDGALIAYTGLVTDSVVAGHEARIVYCEDKNRGIKYVNPRTLLGYEGVQSPTIWIDGKLYYTLNDPDVTFLN